ncbi:hypothetical protein DFS34DRAFT_596727 [Phlyctochytrium arcticum]|nr:hypothetical protein DFS34DRAFT_596727 [Phlyctochytrium arcticum]
MTIYTDDGMPADVACTCICTCVAAYVPFNVHIVHTTFLREIVENGTKELQRRKRADRPCTAGQPPGQDSTLEEELAVFEKLSLLAEVDEISDLQQESVVQDLQDSDEILGWSRYLLVCNGEL